MKWFIAASICALAFAACAVPVRRRFGIGALIVAAAITAILTFTVGALAIARNPPTEGEGFGVVVLGVAALGAVAGGVAAVERVIQGITIPDPLAERAAAAIGFLGGAMAGAGAGVLLAALSGPRIA